MNPEDASVAVPDDPEGPRDSSRPFIIVLSVLGLLGGVIFLLALFTGGPGVSSDREAAVRTVVRSLVSAASRGDGASFVVHFDAERLLRESVRAGVLAEAEGVSPEAIGAGMAELCRRGVGTDRQWRGVRVTRVSFGADGRTADVYARIRRGVGDSRLHLRLTRASGRWKVFDWESMEEALRISSFVPSLLTERVAQEASTEGARAVVSGIRGAMLLGAGGEYERALDVLGKMKAAPPSTPFHAAIARLEAEYLLHQGKPEAALDAAEEGATFEGASPMLVLYRAEALADLGRHEESLAAATAFLARMGDDPEALHLAGVSLRALGREEEAVGFFRKGIRLDPEDYRNRYDLGLHLLERRRTADGADFLIAACRYAPGRLGYFEAAAPELAAVRAYAPLLDLAVDQQGRTPSDTHVAFYRAFALRRLGRVNDAEPVLRAALEEADQGDLLGLRSELALTLAQIGRREEAHGLIEAVERTDAVWGEYLHAGMEVLAGNQAAAVAHLQSVLTLDPTYHRDIEWEPVLRPLVRDPNLSPLIERAAARAEFQEKIVEALEHEQWESMLLITETRKPGVEVDAFYYRGLALRHLGRLAKAREALMSGLRVAEEGMRPAFMEELVRVLAGMGSYMEAHVMVGRMMESGRFPAMALHSRVLVRTLEGERDKAVKTLAELLEAHPAWRVRVEAEPIFKPLRERSDVKELLRRAAER